MKGLFKRIESQKGVEIALLVVLVFLVAEVLKIGGEYVAIFSGFASPMVELIGIIVAAIVISFTLIRVNKYKLR